MCAYKLCRVSFNRNEEYSRAFATGAGSRALCKKALASRCLLSDSDPKQTAKMHCSGMSGESTHQLTSPVASWWAPPALLNMCWNDGYWSGIQHLNVEADIGKINTKSNLQTEIKWNTDGAYGFGCFHAPISYYIQQLSPRIPSPEIFICQSSVSVFVYSTRTQRKTQLFFVRFCDGWPASVRLLRSCILL